MKIECEVEWALEERVDDAVKRAVIKELAGRIEERLYAKIEKETSNALAKMVDDLLMKLTERFMNKEVLVTDKWGDVQEKYESVNELLKAKFDGFLEAKVDRKGEPSKSCGYGSSYDQITRVEYFINKQIDYRKDGIIKELTRIVDDKIDEKKKELTAEMAKKIAAKLA